MGPRDKDMPACWHLWRWENRVFRVSQAPVSCFSLPLLPQPFTRVVTPGRSLGFLNPSLFCIQWDDHIRPFEHCELYG